MWSAGASIVCFAGVWSADADDAFRLGVAGDWLVEVEVPCASIVCLLSGIIKKNWRN